MTPAEWDAHVTAYRARLASLASTIDAKVLRPAHATCLARLTSPRHRCGGSHWQGLPSCLDHVAWLRRRDGSWALLSQSYGIDVSGLDRLASEHGLMWCLLPGEAPYGYGTTAVLITALDKEILR